MKMAVIGAAGGLGSATAFCVGQKGLMDEIKMIDVKKNVMETHVMDLYQSLLEDTHTRFTMADYPDITDCDIIVITASVPYNPAVTDRSANLKLNYEIVESICREMKPYLKPGAIVITGTNPIEMYTYAYYKLLGVEKNKVIGFCAPDMIRMKWAIEEITGIPYAAIDAYCVGEHGKAIRLYEQAMVDGKPLVLTDEQKVTVEKMNVEWFAHWQSCRSGRTTTWTSSIHITKIIEAILSDEGAILPAAAVLDGEFGLKDVAVDMICRIGKSGIEEIIDPKFTQQQLSDLNITAERLLDMERQICLL